MGGEGGAGGEGDAMRRMLVKDLAWKDRGGVEALRRGSCNIMEHQAVLKVIVLTVDSIT